MVVAKKLIDDKYLLYKAIHERECGRSYGNRGRSTSVKDITKKVINIIVCSRDLIINQVLRLQPLRSVRTEKPVTNGGWLEEEDDRREKKAREKGFQVYVKKVNITQKPI